MAESLDTEGFLGRWAKRKAAVRSGQSAAEPLSATEEPSTSQAPQPQVLTASADSASALAGTNHVSTQPANQPPAPTLQDTAQLTPQSDFRPFMARNVAPEVKNAAMKKLFADPHFNTMDMLDVYVDDYSKPDPMPASMLRQLASAKFLKLFDDEEEAEKKAQVASGAAHSPATGDDADTNGAAAVAQSEPDPGAQAQPQALTSHSAAATDATPSPSTHDHPDLQLQPNHAPGRPGPGQGAG